MFARKNLNFLGILSGVYGIVSLLLPWWILDSRGYISPIGFFHSSWYEFRPLPYYTLTHLSAILAITMAIMILGCFTVFLGSFTPGRKGKLLMFSAGMSFVLAPIIFLLSLNLLFSGVERVFFGTMSGYSSSVSSGFIMAFVAAAPAFLSLGNLRRIKFFLLAWALISFVSIGFWYIVYGLHPSVLYYHERVSALVTSSPFFSLMLTSILTLVYGIYLVLKKK